MIALLDPRLWLVALALLLMAAVGGYAKGRSDERGRVQAELLKRTEQARQVEQEWARKVKVLGDAKDAEIDRINGRLADALERLRKRPERLPEPARAACAGATGAQLSGPDAGFLEREAARADALRAALEQCYGWIDAVKGISAERQGR